MLKKILYADSGANNAQQLLKLLLELPSFKSAELTLLKAFSSSTTKEKEEASTKDAESRLKELIGELGIAESRVSTIVRGGEPKSLVLEVAKELNTDLIIMGSRAMGKLQAILSNSVSQYVFQLTDRSMLLVKDTIYVKRIKRVMVAIDKSPAAQYALDSAISLFRDYKDAEFFLTRVNPDLKPGLKLTKEDMENNPILSAAAKKVKRAGIDYRCILTGGRPAQKICNLAEDNNIDFIVLGSPERRPSVAKNLPDLERLLGSSLSDYIRVKAECPVLLVRQDEK